MTQKSDDPREPVVREMQSLQAMMNMTLETMQEARACPDVLRRSAATLLCFRAATKLQQQMDAAYARFLVLDAARVSEASDG